MPTAIWHPEILLLVIDCMLQLSQPEQIPQMLSKLVLLPQLQRFSQDRVPKSVRRRLTRSRYVSSLVAQIQFIDLMPCQ